MYFVGLKPVWPNVKENHVQQVENFSRIQVHQRVSRVVVSVGSAHDNKDHDDILDNDSHDGIVAHKDHSALSCAAEKVSKCFLPERDHICWTQGGNASRQISICPRAAVHLSRAKGRSGVAPPKMQHL